MKFTVVSALAAGAAAFVIPDVATLAEIVLDDGASRAHAAVDAAAAGAANLDGWVRSGVARVGRVFADAAASGAGAMADELQQAVNAVLAADGVASALLETDGKKETTFANQTLYQLIAASNTTTQFAALVGRFPALVARLNDTAVNSTVFVPVDTAFAAVPAGALDDAAFASALAHYHVANATVPFAVLFNTHTVPSLVEEPRLGGAGRLQRLRLRFEKHLGLSVNFDSHVVAPNFVAANGVLHAVDALLAPPLPAARALALAPTHFSTLLLALNRTGLAADLDAAAGATVFAPSNEAFTLLGPSINAFLFNSPVGLKYLRALLRYAVAPNATVYSDAYYGPADAVVVAPPVFAAPITRATYKLPTLLGAGNASVAVNVTAVPGFVFMTANQAAVAVQDGIAQNGVVHEVGRVVLPPNATATLPWDDYKSVTTVPELVARLAPYMDDALPSDGDVAAALPAEL